MQTSITSRLTRIASLLVAAILVLLPFHAVLTTWAGSNFGHLDLFRIWKELLLVSLGLYAAWLVVRDDSLNRRFSRSWLVWLSVIYTLLYIGFGLYSFQQDHVNAPALLFSLLTNLRFVWFMMIVWVISSQDQLLQQIWAKLLLIPAALVIGFGLLQRFILPDDFLKHFGYGPDTIPAVQTIDNKPEYHRIQSTLRGANPLGAYLVLVITALVAKLKSRVYMPLVLLACLLVLFFSYSRSAWVGVVVSLGVLGWLQLPKAKNHQAVVISLVLALTLAVGSVWIFRDNDTLQNTLFHSDENSTSAVSSNAARTSYIRQAVQDIADQPLGGGPGTAGPASMRNDHPARIAENYYLQIGQEAGVIGLVLFLGILAATTKQLWQRRKHLLAQILLASLAGISVINILSHAWTDDTLSLLWWGLAGIALSIPVIMTSEHKQHEKAKTKSTHSSRAVSR